MTTPTQIAFPRVTIDLDMLAMDAEKIIKVLEARVLSSTPEDLPAAAADFFSVAEHLAKMGTEPQPLKPLGEPPGPGGSGMAIGQYATARADHRSATATIHGLKRDFLALFNPDQLDLLKIADDERVVSQYSLCELKTRFLAVFGQFRAPELRSIRATMRAPKVDLSKPPHGLISDFNKAAKTLKDNNREVPDSEQCDDLLAAIGGPHGVYKQAVLGFSMLPADKQKIATLQAAVLAEYSRLLTVAPASLTAAGAGFAAAAAAATPPAPPAGGGGGGKIGSHGTGTTAAPNAAGRMPRQQPLLSPTTKDGNRNPSTRVIRDKQSGQIKAIIPDTHYCWSHGPHAAGCGFTPHGSAGCPSKEPGHQDGATFADVKGGRSIFCRENQRAKYPHA